MSRSYKKTPYHGERKGKRKKRVANHTVRQFLKRNSNFIAPPNFYKKLYETWDICDYSWITSWKEY